MLLCLSARSTSATFANGTAIRLPRFYAGSRRRPEPFNRVLHSRRSGGAPVAMSIILSPRSHPPYHESTVATGPPKERALPHAAVAADAHQIDAHRPVALSTGRDSAIALWAWNLTDSAPAPMKACVMVKLSM
jgi:hypothetical protein